MIGPRAFAARRITKLLLGGLLIMASLSAVAWAGTATAGEVAISVADLERLMHQIEDQQQREQLLNTLQTLILTAKQHHRDDVPLQEKPNLFADQSQGLFFAFGELTQYIGTLGRRVGLGLATIPTILVELPAQLRDPETFWFMTAIVLSALILVMIGIILQLITSRLEAKLRAHAVVREPLLRRRKVWFALITVGLGVAPYVLLLVVSGVVFSILPVGAIPSGLAALVIFTCLVYRLLRAVARVLLDPDPPSARLMPINDATAQRMRDWVVRLIILVVVYFLITRTLLTIGAAGELYQVVRGIMLIILASVLSVMIWRLTQAQRPTAATAENQSRRPWASVSGRLQDIWPIVAIAYLWCVTLLALFRSPRGVTFMVAASLQMALVIGAGIALLWGGDRLFHHATALNDRVGRYLPGLESRTLRYLRMMWWSIRMLIVVVSLLIVLQLWGVDIAWFLTSPLGSDLLSRLITLLVTVAIVMVIMDLSTFMSQKLIESTQGDVEAKKKRRTLVPLTATVIKYSALFAGILIALHAIGVNVTPILAGVGILSLAVGFGAQTLVKDIINGLFILVEDSLAIGDVVNIRGTGGVVEAVNLRTIWLRDLQGSVHIIPNSQVEMISNMTKDYAYYVLNVSVAYREDTDEVIAALQEIDADMRADPALAADMLAPIEILGVDRFNDSAVVIAARLKTKPIKQWSVGREFNRRMKKLFDARNIEMPFPHRTIYWGGPTRAEAAPMQFRIENLERRTTPTGKGDYQTATRHEDNTDA
jgi:small-conductance mechanosensitive channel